MELSPDQGQPPNPTSLGPRVKPSRLLPGVTRFFLPPLHLPGALLLLQLPSQQQITPPKSRIVTSPQISPLRPSFFRPRHRASHRHFQCNVSSLLPKSSSQPSCSSSFSHSFISLLSSSHVPGSILSTRDTAINRPARSFLSPCLCH